MVSTNLLVIAAVLVPATFARTCKYDGQFFGYLKNHTCTWYGSAPACGGTTKTYGQEDEKGATYVASTELADKVQLCHAFGGKHQDIWPGDDCCGAYGYGCLSGYKRLWCDKNFYDKPYSYVFSSRSGYLGTTGFVAGDLVSGFAWKDPT
ncbi:hypothetical protein PT974_01878 [Cladobotryum mycophilum]|uniref:Secreted protein n=1 Tax=Cladobotryum mycophilum TaxID=491253 RepID=A0ABR0SWM7_9HYPO